MTHADEIVLTEKVERTLIITLNRPGAYNAMTQAMSYALADAVDHLDSDPSITVGVLTGAGGHFCSGMDLKAFLQGDRPEVPGRGFGGFTKRPPSKPIIAAVNGYALAGGFELALTCDLIVADEHAKFGLPETRRGLIAGSGGLLRLGQRVPSQIAMEYALTGKHMTAAEASRWGLVNQIAGPGAALEAALALASEIAANAPLAVQESKRILTELADLPWEERWDQQEEALQRIFKTADAAEGASAFSEKREPVWKGE